MAKYSVKVVKENCNVNKKYGLCPSRESLLIYESNYEVAFARKDCNWIIKRFLMWYRTDVSPYLGLCSSTNQTMKLHLKEISCNNSCNLWNTIEY